MSMLLRCVWTNEYTFRNGTGWRQRRGDVCRLVWRDRDKIFYLIWGDIIEQVFSVGKDLGRVAAMLENI